MSTERKPPQGQLPSRADPARRRLEGICALVLVQMLFGLFAVLVKVTTDDGAGFAPRAIAFWRIVGGAIVFGAICAWRHRGEFLPDWRDFRLLLLLGLFGIVINQVLALEGVARTSATLAGMLMTTIPVFTYGLAVLVRQETLSLRRALGIGVALLGAVLLVAMRGVQIKGGGTAGSEPLLGSLLITLNCLSYSGFLILARGLLLRRPTLWVIAWTFLVALLALPFLASGVELMPADVSERALKGMAVMILVSTISAYLLNTYALARVSASTTATFIFLQPLVAGASAWVFLGERPAATSLMPVALLFGGIYLVVGARGSRAEESQEAPAAPRRI